jgi:hypothetical protein
MNARSSKSIVAVVSLAACTVFATGCAALDEESEARATASQDPLVTATKIPAGWENRCVVIAPDGVNVRAAGGIGAKVLYSAQCHDWFYPAAPESDGWVKVNKLPRGAEAGTKVDDRYASGFVKAQYLNCFHASAGIDPGAWVNAVPACGPAGLDIQPVDKAAVKRDAQSGVAFADDSFSSAWLRTRPDGFSFYGRSAVSGTAICSYVTSRESGVVAQATLAPGGEFYCQVSNKPGARFFHWFK